MSFFIEKIRLELVCPTCDTVRELGLPNMMNMAAFKQRIDQHKCGMCPSQLDLVHARFQFVTKPDIQYEKCFSEND